MQLLIISGSMRYPSGSRLAAGYLKRKVEEQSLFSKVDLLDLGQSPIPLWDEGVWQGAEKWRGILTGLKEQLQAADAYIFVIPEYNGMASPGIKNLTLFFDERITGHKPVLLTAVTSEEHNGQYPISDMRAYGSKNTKWIYVPDHLIYRRIRELISDDLQMNDRSLEDRTLYSLKELYAYAGALKEMRKQWTFRPEFKYAP